MEKEIVDLLIVFTEIKGSIRLQIPPSPDLLNDNLFLIEKFNSEFNVIKEICSATLIQ